MKEKVLKILNENKRALSLLEIDNMLNLNSKEELKKVKDILDELEKEVVVYYTNKKKYLLFKNSHLYKGVLRVNKKGFGFVEIEGKKEDLYIDSNNFNGAINNDIIIVEVIRQKRLGREEGKVVRILHREFDNFVGELIVKQKKPYLKFDDDKIKLIIEIDQKLTKGAVAGHKVIVKVTKALGKNRYKGEVLRILGHKNDPGVDILSVVHRYNINDIFKEEVIKEVVKIPNIVSNDDLKKRRDLRNEEIFTIDGMDAKDLDDAISLRRLANGNYLLGVHIADVSYYVKEKSAIDEEAYDRATSIYLVDRVIPMLPYQLSNGICSLNEHDDRLCITCEMEIDNTGKVINYDIFESVINSKKKMTYEEVNQILEHNKKVKGYEEFIPTLKEMAKLASILRKHKEDRGYIDFDIDEAKVYVDQLGKPIDIVKRYRGIAENLIEDFMIVANETVAGYLYFMELPFIYRIHEYPELEKIELFVSFIKILGYQAKEKITNIHPKTIQQIIEGLKGKKEFPILSNLLLRSMQKAIYSPENKGHYGLASKYYTHFTAPIRRYPDTTVHRLLRTYLFNNKIDNETKNYWQLKLEPLCKLASVKERRAIDCEREVMDMKMAEYMQDHIGEEFEGIIAAVMNFGIFVQLDNLIEGLVHVTELKDDYYTYNERMFSLIGERTKKRYRIGDIIKIRVKAASKEQHNIDFEIVGKVKV